MEGVVTRSNFWSGRRVLITGHTGFKGSWLSLWLGTLGARVHGFSLRPDCNPSLYELADVEKGLVSHIGDVRDFRAVNDALRDANPEAVFHLAAQSLVRSSYTDPLGTIATNVMGTAHLLDGI